MIAHDPSSYHRELGPWAAGVRLQLQRTKTSGLYTENRPHRPSYNMKGRWLLTP